MYKGEMIALDTPEALKARLNVHSMEDVFVNLIDKEDASAVPSVRTEVRQ